MYKLATTTLFTLLAATSVSGAALVPRTNPPPGWRADILEPYQEYHTRYLAIGCQFNHGKQFFDDCCHPMKKWEKLETARKPYCIPSKAQSSSASAVEATSTVTTPADVPGGDPTVPTPAPGGDDDDDGLEDCPEDGDDEPAPSPTPAPSKPAPPPPPPPSKPTTQAPPPPPPSPSPSPKPSPPPAPAPPPPPPPSPSPPPNNGGGDITGGHGTFYFQNGNAGACGQFNPDSAPICAMDARRYGPTNQRSPLCGRQVLITNTNNGKSVTCTIADACPTCDNSNSIDMSTGAFDQIATRQEGLVPISWHFVN